MGCFEIFYSMGVIDRDKLQCRCYANVAECSGQAQEQKELTEALYFLLLGLAPNIRSLELGPVFQDATQNVSLARLVQALPDDVKDFIFPEGAIPPEIGQIRIC